MKYLFILLSFLIVIPVFAGEIEDLKKDQTLVRMEIEKELANLRAAQSDIARIQLLFPQLQARDALIRDKIDALEKKNKEAK